MSVTVKNGYLDTGYQARRLEDWHNMCVEESQRHSHIHKYKNAFIVLTFG